MFVYILSLFFVLIRLCTRRLALLMCNVCNVSMTTLQDGTTTTLRDEERYKRCASPKKIAKTFKPKYDLCAPKLFSIVNSPTTTIIMSLSRLSRASAPFLRTFASNANKAGQVNKEDLVRLVATSTKIPQKDVAAVITGLVHSITTAVSEDKRVSVPKLGIFHRRVREERKGRNPSTGEEAVFPKKAFPAFKMSNTFKEAVAARGSAV